MNIDEIKKHFCVRFDKDLTEIFNLSTSAISKWRNEGIPMLWQESIQLRTQNMLIARSEDVKINMESQSKKLGGNDDK